MAVCHLLRDSSRIATEKLSSIIVPATTITRMSMREQQEVENVRLEVRIVALEKRFNMIQALVIKEKERNNESVRRLEN